MADDHTGRDSQTQHSSSTRPRNLRPVSRISCHVLMLIAMAKLVCQREHFDPPDTAAVDTRPELSTGTHAQLMVVGNHKFVCY